MALRAGDTPAYLKLRKPSSKMGVAPWNTMTKKNISPILAFIV